MTLAMPLRAATGAGTDIGLLDAPTVHIDLGQGSPIAIVSERAKRHFAGSDQRLHSTLRRVPARFVQLGGVHVGEPDLLVMAHERVAVDGNAALAGERR